MVLDHRIANYRASHDNDPVLVLRDRNKGYTKENVALVSARASRLIDGWTKKQLLAMTTPPAGYTLDEVRKVADWLIS